MKSLMMRWKEHPLYPIGFPPFLGRKNVRKQEVRGTSFHRCKIVESSQRFWDTHLQRAPFWSFPSAGHQKICQRTQLDSSGSQLCLAPPWSMNQKVKEWFWKGTPGLQEGWGMKLADPKGGTNEECDYVANQLPQDNPCHYSHIQ